MFSNEIIIPLSNCVYQFNFNCFIPSFNKGLLFLSLDSTVLLLKISNSINITNYITNIKVLIHFKLFVRILVIIPGFELCV